MLASRRIQSDRALEKATEQLTGVEGLVGETLVELVYELAISGRHAYNPQYRTWNRLLYRQFFDLKLQSKKNHVLRAVRKPLTSKEVDNTVLMDESGGADSDAAGDNFGLRRGAELIKSRKDGGAAAETGDRVRNRDDLCVANLGLVLLGSRQATEEGPHQTINSASCFSKNWRSRARTVERARPLAVQITNRKPDGTQPPRASEHGASQVTVRAKEQQSKSCTPPS